MRKKVLLYAVVLALLMTLVPTYAINARMAKLVDFKGRVEVKREASEKKIKAFRNMSLSEGDTIYTGEKSKAVLELDGDKKVTISAKSTVVLSELSRSAKSTDTAITLKNGGVGSKLNKKLDKSSKYKIKTPTTVMGVRGTEFFVQSSIFEKNVPKLNDGDKAWRKLNTQKAYLNEGILAVQLLSRDNSALLKFDDDDDRPSEFLMKTPKMLNIDGDKAKLEDYTPKGLHREFLEEIRAMVGSLFKQADYETALAQQADRDKKIAEQMEKEGLDIPKVRIIEADVQVNEEGGSESEPNPLPPSPPPLIKVVEHLYLYDHINHNYHTLNNVRVEYVVNGSMADLSYTHTDGITYKGSRSLTYVESVPTLSSLDLHHDY